MVAECVAYRAVVPAQRPRAARPVTRENHVHRSSRADGALEFAAAATYFPAVLRSAELGADLRTEERQLHRGSMIILRVWGNVVC